MARLPQAVAADQWQQHLATVLSRPVLLEAAGPERIKHLAWCTGAAQDGIIQAVHHGADAYITGEASERTVHEARELGIHLYVAGHHATERYGVQALGAHCAEKFGLDHHFIDVDNPI